MVRAAADSLIPADRPSATRHVTLIDFVADRRAPTPTAAAEMAVPVRLELIDRIDSLARRLLSSWARGHDHRRTELRAAARALPSGETPLDYRASASMGAPTGCHGALIANAQAHHAAYTRVASRLTPHTLRIRILRNRERVLWPRRACRPMHCGCMASAGAIASPRSRRGFQPACAEAQAVRIARGRERIDGAGRPRRAER